MKKINPVIRVLFAFMLAGGSSFAEENEIIRPTQTRIAVREHPKTGKEYVTIIGENEVRQVPLTGELKEVIRPDYRMLDPKVKSGEIPYEGPVSSRKKVYVLAGALAATGVASSLAAAAAIPAAGVSTGAAGGAGVYGAAGVGVLTSAGSGVWLKSRPDPHREDFDFKSESKEIKN